MYLLAKFGGHRSYGSEDIYFTWRPRKKFKSLHPSAYCEILKIRNTDLQFRSPWHNLLKNNNNKKNAGNCKALWISRNRNKIFFHFLNICAKKMSRNETILVLIRKNQDNYQHKLNLLKVLFATSKQWLWVYFKSYKCCFGAKETWQELQEIHLYIIWCNYEGNGGIVSGGLHIFQNFAKYFMLP